MTREEFIVKWSNGMDSEQLKNIVLDLDELLSLPPAEGAEKKKTCVLCTNPAMDNGLCFEHNVCNVPKQPQPTAEGAEEYLRSKITDDLTFNAFDIKQAYPIWLLAKWIEEFATLHAQRLAEKMVEEQLPSNKKIHEAALAWAKEHSNAPDKDCPDWLIRDYEAGAYFVRQCMGCWNKE